MKKSMDMFGKALEGYSKGDKSPFYFVIGKELETHDLSRYFRKPNELSKIEYEMISLCRGKILDVGCGTANYFPKLNQRGDVLGIDLSPKIINIAKRNGFNCIVQDIFNYSPKNKFDTITLFENNIGIAGNITRTKILLKKLKNLLNEKGQILTLIRNSTPDYFKIKLQPMWKGKKGEKFEWIILNEKYLKKLCEKERLKLEIKAREGKDTLIRIYKENN